MERNLNQWAGFAAVLTWIMHTNNVFNYKTVGHWYLDISWLVDLNTEKINTVEKGRQCDKDFKLSPQTVSSAFIYRKVTRLHVTVHFDNFHFYKYP